ncbi:MAG: A/G-specific adenine glycosylase [Verrucomicrobiota bacterium]|jgi:A/G-specific adenine glycosylase
MARIARRNKVELQPSDVASRLVSWFATSARDLPWRHTLDPYAIWVSEAMLQQTQVRTVIPYWTRWMQRLPTVQDLANAHLDEVLKLWEGLGYYRRARHLHSAARRVMAVQGGRLPVHSDDWLALPGIGRYTAGAIASIAFNEPAPILDGNVARVVSRLMTMAGSPKDRSTSAVLWSQAKLIVEAAQALPTPAPLPHAPLVQLSGPCSAVNQSLMELGALVCTPANPSCSSCPLREPCRAHAMGRTADFPSVSTRPATTRRTRVAVLWHRSGRWLVRQRPGDDVNGGLWEFPGLECGPGDDPKSVLARWLGVEPSQLALAGTIRHAITRHRISQHFFRLEGPASRPATPADAEWKTVQEIEALAWTAAHRRALALARF